MSKEATVEDAPPTQEQVCLVPGYAFFVERLPLPEGLEAEEVGNFAELSLETLSPFPLEQLNWGWIQDEDSTAILLYATHRERLKQLGFANLEAYLWVLPDFAPLATLRFDQATTLRLESTEGHCLLTFAAGQSLPLTVQAQAGDSHLAEDPTEPLHVFCHQATIVPEAGLPTFHYDAEPRPVGSEDVTGRHIRLPENSLWAADLRAPAYKQNERNRRRLASLVGKTTGYAGFAALVLIVCELLLFVGNAWLGTRETKIAGQAQEVRRIEDKQSLMNKLDQVAQNELQPIAILEALNEERPGGIYFTSTIIEGRNRIVVDGIATTISELNAYIASLRDSGKFHLVGNPEQITRSGRTTFTVTLDFLGNPPADSSPDPTEA